MDFRKSVLNSTGYGMQMLHNNFQQKYGVPFWEYQPQSQFGQALQGGLLGLLEKSWDKRGLPYGGLLAMSEADRQAYIQKYLK